jgi:hypothetical protein
VSADKQSPTPVLAVKKESQMQKMLMALVVVLAVSCFGSGNASAQAVAQQQNTVQPQKGAVTSTGQYDLKTREGLTAYLQQPGRQRSKMYRILRENSYQFEKALRAQIAGANDPECGMHRPNHANTGATLTATTDFTGTDSSGPHYDPMCPQGRWDYH